MLPRTTFAFTAATLGLLGASTASAQELATSPGDRWPGFRGVGTGHSRARDLPTHWSPKTSIAWRRTAPGVGQSSPVIAKNRVFVTSVEGPNKELCFVTCYRLGDGQMLWSRSFPAGVPIKSTRMVSRGAPTPAVDDACVYALFESGDVFALDHDGNRRWHRCLTKEYGAFQGNHGIGSSVVQSTNSIVLLIDHSGPSYLVRLRKSDGKNIWKHDRTPRISWSTPVLSASRGEILVSSNGTVDGVALDSGELRWSLPDVEGNTVPSPTVFGDRVIVAASKGGSLVIRPPHPATANAAEANTAKATIEWQMPKTRPSGFASPIIHQDALYVINKAGALSCVDLNTGKSRWRHRLPESCWASPIAAEGRIYFFGKGGSTTVIRPGATAPEILAENRITADDDELTVYGAAAVDGALVLRSEKRLWCVQKK